MNGLESRILENMTTAVLLFDQDLRLCYVNAAAEMLFGVSARHVLGQFADDVLPCPVGELQRKLAQALAGGQPFTERELPLRVADGQEIRVDCSVEPVQTHQDTDGLLMELHRVDRQLRISREEHLLSQQKATQALVRGLAHEIKNPLGGLRGAAQLLEGELPDPALREYTRVIIEEADRLQVLVDRLSGPRTRVPRQSINIHWVLERVRQLVEAEFGEGLRLERDYDPSIPPIQGDQDQLIQAFLNIARNGARAVGQQGVIRVRTRVQRQFTIGNLRHRLVLAAEVEDSGPGVPAELQERIFLPMVSGSEGGTGLGLSIAQTLINQHGGLIECRSTPGKTQFIVLLPIERDHG